MGLKFNEFKEWNSRREFGDMRSSYLEVVRLVEALYQEQEIKFFYPRNIWNDNNKEFIFFIEDAYFIVNLVEDDFVIQHYNSKLKNKTLKTSRYHNVNQLLTLEFDNGESLLFNSSKDSNHQWEENYAETIRDLYKII